MELFLNSFFKLIRPHNLLVIAVTQLMSFLFLVTEISHKNIVVWKILFATSFITAAGYIINDYYDVKIDVINKPKKVVVGRGLSRRWAMLLHLVLSLIGFLIGLSVSKYVAVYMGFSIFLLWLYSNRLKQIPLLGNIAIAVLTSMSILIIALVFPNAHKPEIVAYSVFAFFASLIRQIIKDIEDMPGDIKHGCVTLPVVVGIKRTKEILYMIMAIFVTALSAITFLLLPTLSTYLFSVIYPLLFFVAYKTYLADTASKYSALNHLTKILMIVGVISMVWV